MCSRNRRKLDKIFQGRGKPDWRFIKGLLSANRVGRYLLAWLLALPLPCFYLATDWLILLWNCCFNARQKDAASHSRAFSLHGCWLWKTDLHFSESVQSFTLRVTTWFDGLTCIWIKFHWDFLDGEGSHPCSPVVNQGNRHLLQLIPQNCALTRQPSNRTQKSDSGVASCKSTPYTRRKSLNTSRSNLPSIRGDIDETTK